MKTIKNVIVTLGNELEIHHKEGFLRIENSPGSRYKSIKLYTSKTQLEKARFNPYSSFSKDELIGFQNILLKAYFFVDDQLEDAINKSESKKLLDEIKIIIIATRIHLRFITKYVDSYEDVLKEYKDI
jgi:hypothetical protein